MKYLLTLIFILTCTLAFAQVIPAEQPQTTRPVVKKHTTPAKKPTVATPATGSLTLPMVFVQGGSFSMGSNDDGDDAKPIHSVTVSSFYIGKYELTVGEFRKFINATNYKTSAEQEGWSYIWTGNKYDKQNGVTWEFDSYGFKRPPTQDIQPVIHVSWDDATRYCQWLSSQTGKVYRLPTEAEWEYAAKGGSKSNGYTYSGSNDLASVAWYKDNSNSQTHQGGQKQANELGIYDMTGNVWEWCQDWYDKDYYASSPTENPQGPSTGSGRGLRGGGWGSPALPCCVALRAYGTPGRRSFSIGFRLVLVPTPATKPVVKKHTLPVKKTAVTTDAAFNGFIPLAYVQGGSFDMGSNDAQDYKAQPVHRVTLGSFYMGRYEVTQAQWKAIMGNNPSNFQNCDDCPVEMASWDDVQGFIEKLNQKTGKHYRLPTEAEWEYAARGGSKSNGYTYSGFNDISSVAWYSDNGGSKTHPKGQKQANELGIYDMSGNVWEWCQDWFGADYYSNSPAENPQGPSSGSDRVLRGGSWRYPAQICRVAYRSGSSPGYRRNFFGFRLVLVP